MKFKNIVIKRKSNKVKYFKIYMLNFKVLLYHNKSVVVQFYLVLFNFGARPLFGCPSCFNIKKHLLDLSKLDWLVLIFFAASY